MIYLHGIAAFIWGFIMIWNIFLAGSNERVNPILVAIPAFSSFVYALGEVVRLL